MTNMLRIGGNKKPHGSIMLIWDGKQFVGSSVSTGLHHFMLLIMFNFLKLGLVNLFLFVI